jgi:hypothetical protein
VFVLHVCALTFQEFKRDPADYPVTEALLKPIGTMACYDSKSGGRLMQLRKNIGVLSDSESNVRAGTVVELDEFGHLVEFEASTDHVDEGDVTVNEAQKNFDRATREAFNMVDEILGGDADLSHEDFLDGLRERGLL